MADYKQVKLPEGARWNPFMTYKLGQVPQSIAGYVFTGYLLDEMGGTRLLEVPIENLEDDSADGTTGRFQPRVTKAQSVAFRADNTIPTWFEIYVVIPGDTDPLKWMDIAVLYGLGGQA